MSGERSLTDFRGVSDPVLRVTKLGYVAFQTSDVDRLVAYYVNALQFVVTERSAGAAYLTTGSDHHCVVITHGETAGRTRVGFEIRGSLDDAEGRLKAGGLPVERRTDSEPGIAACLVVEEPGGVPLHLFEAQAQSGEPTVAGTRPTKLGHIASHVAPDELAQTQMFYEDVLGFRWSDTVQSWFVFLRSGPDHHTVNLLARPARDGSYAGMHHIAYETRDVVHFRDVLDHLSKIGVVQEWGPGRHGVGHNLFAYHRDPDHNLIEIFTEVDLIFDERTGYFEPRPWHEEYPQGPRVWDGGQSAANVWGPMAPGAPL